MTTEYGEILFNGEPVENIRFANEDVEKVLYQGVTVWPSTSSTLQSFTLGYSSYNFEEGMTWTDWVYSEYNTTPYDARVTIAMVDDVEGLYQIYENGDGSVEIMDLYIEDDGTIQTQDTVITANVRYITDFDVNYPIYVDNYSSNFSTMVYFGRTLDDWSFELEPSSAIETTNTGPILLIKEAGIDADRSGGFFVQNITGGTNSLREINGEYYLKITIADKVNGANVTLNTYAETCCFEAGTQIAMADGTTKGIEDVIVGDKILAYNTDTKEFIVTTVIATPTNPEVTNVAVVTLENDISIRMNEYHPILTTEGYHSITQHEGLPELKVGDIVITNNGQYAIVDISRTVQDKEKMYNLTVNSEYHNYIANTMVVHNALCPI